MGEVKFKVTKRTTKYFKRDEHEKYSGLTIFSEVAYNCPKTGDIKTRVLVTTSKDLFFNELDKMNYLNDNGKL